MTAIDQDPLIGEWQRRKTTGGFYRLRAPCERGYEFRGPRWGQPSNYAAVRFDCQPAERLTFASRARWPDDRERCESAIRVAVVDGLLGPRLAPYRGCALALVEISWDDVMSTPLAFYVATRRAMEDLVVHSQWEHVGLT